MIEVTAARYSYDTYANVTYQAFTWPNMSDTNTVFAYDDQNRVTAAYGQGFGWQPWGSLGSVGGATYGYTAGHPHAVDLVNGVDRYDYDANGSMVVRSKGVSGQEQALQWDANNRLAQVVSSSGVTETYLYDESGQRIRRQVAYSSTVGDTVTYVPFAFYEQAVSAGGSVVTRHYTVNGERVAVRVDGALYYLYRDQVGSTILASDALTNVVGSRGYYAFGATRRSSGLTPTDRRFTGQVEDPTGLYYYNSRYYDPQLGQFISPDTIVPEPNNLLSYNRYLYAKGNPLINSDPTGHCAVAAVAGPAGLAVDVPCWLSGAGEAVAAGTAVAAVSAVSAVALLNFALDDPLPDYPAPATNGDFDTIGESFPLPGATTIPINGGVPLVQPLDTTVPGEQTYDPSEMSVLADPMGNPDIGSSVYNTSQLRRNMIGAGQVPPAESDAHHIVAANALGAAVSKELLKGAGIDINSPANGVYLPSNLRSANPTGATVHSVVHTTRYYAQVERRLKLVGEAGVANELNRIREELQNGTFPY